MNFFSWLTSEKKDEIPTSRPIITQTVRNNRIENVPKATMDILKVETFIEQTDAELPKPSTYTEQYIQECAKCRYLFFMSEKLDEYVCISCQTRKELNPSQECNKCGEIFVVPEITNNYVCEPCKINDVWKDDWNGDFSEENDKTPNDVLSEIPTPPPPPKPYVPKHAPNGNISRKLFDTPVNTSSKDSIDVIDWNKVTEGWNNLYEDCKFDLGTAELDLEIQNFIQNPPEFIWPEPQVPQESAEFADSWVFGPVITQNDWDIEKGYPFFEKNETSSEEYFFPKHDRFMDQPTYEPLVDELVDELVNKSINNETTEELSSSTDEYEEDFEPNPEGTLELILGPMYSGKSTAALLKLAQMADIGFDVLYINHADDVRTTEAQDGVVSTHNSQYTSLSKKINSMKISELKGIDVRNYQYIGVDEGQFFPDLYENVLKWVSVYGKNVIVSSLDGDAYRRKFGQVLDLVPNADSVTKLKAFCDICRESEKKIKPAPFTARLTGGTDAKVVGGRNLYLAMCRECHNKHLTETGL